MSSTSTSPVATESNGSSLSGVSLSATNGCDDRTCSAAKCALCLHCSQQYCFVHFLKHNEQLSLNAYNFTWAIDQLEDQIKSLKLDESLRRTIHSLDQWRKNLFRTIEYVYQEKLSSIKSNYIQLSNYLQQFQFEQSSHIQSLRIDLEQMKFVRSTYDQEMDKIQATIKQLQKNISELQYDLQLKEHQTPNIYDSIECELIWKRHRTDHVLTSPLTDINDDDDKHQKRSVNRDDEDVQDYSTAGTPPPSTPSPTSYEHCLLSFLVGSESVTNKDEKTISTDLKKNLPNKSLLSSDKKQTFNTTSTPTTIVLNNSNKKRRMCVSCGKCYHPSSLQRHYRQCKHQLTLQQLNRSDTNSKLLDEATLRTVTNVINQQTNVIDS